MPVIQVNHARDRRGARRCASIRARARRAPTAIVGIQEAFVDVHLRNVSDRYDFDSVRVGIQPFISDFRGFLFQDVPFGVRLFGTRDNNQWQYNLGVVPPPGEGHQQRLERHQASRCAAMTCSSPTCTAGLPGARASRTQATVIYNINREIGHATTTTTTASWCGRRCWATCGRTTISVDLSRLQRRRALRRLESRPLAVRRVRHATTAIRSRSRRQNIRAVFAAAELSRDFDWLRVRGNALVASGDKNPFDGKATGFDAILENPQFAGADTSFWIRQAVPLIGGGGVALSGRNGVLPSLRSSKDQGQSNFVNPGLMLLGIGADADVTPQLRVLGNLIQAAISSTRRRSACCATRRRRRRTSASMSRSACNTARSCRRTSCSMRRPRRCCRARD